MNISNEDIILIIIIIIILVIIAFVFILKSFTYDCKEKFTIDNIPFYTEKINQELNQELNQEINQEITIPDDDSCDSNLCANKCINECVMNHDLPNINDLTQDANNVTGFAI